MGKHPNGLGATDSIETIQWKKRHPFECAVCSISMFNVKIINGRAPFKVVRCHIGSIHRNEMYALSNNILETKKREMFPLLFSATYYWSNRLCRNFRTIKMGLFYFFLYCWASIYLNYINGRRVFRTNFIVVIQLYYAFILQCYFLSFLF